VNGRRNGSVGGEDSVCEFEEGVGPALEAFVEGAAEAVESIGGFHDAPIMHPPPASRTPYLLVGLKRKLRASVNRRVACGSTGTTKAVGSAGELLALGWYFPTITYSLGLYAFAG
jgi:hypothetical protein